MAAPRALRLSITQLDISPFSRTAPCVPTVADYAAQALVSTILAKHFPEIPLIGEEDAKDLNDADQHSVRDKIVELANGAVSGSFGTEADQAVWDSLGREARSTEQWLEAIDRGNAQYSSKGRE